MTEKKTTKTVITVVAAAAIALAAFGGGFLTARLTRSKSSQSFDWVVKTIKNNYYEDVSTDDLTVSSLEGLAACLDRYSAYYTAEEYQALLASNSGSKSGIGVSYFYVGEGVHPQGKTGIIIEYVVGNSPAYYGGLRAGEFVFGGRTLEGRTVAFESSDDFSDFIDEREKDEQFVLICDHGEKTVSKQDYTASYCNMATSSAEWSITYRDGQLVTVEHSGEGYGISCLPQGAAYLRLDQFYGNAPYEMAALIEKYNAENCTSLILDLRGNGGGYVDVMCSISDIFTGELPDRNAVAMVAVYKDGRKEGYTVRDDFSGDCQLPAGTPVAVLADNGTASASEALIGVLVENGVIGYEDIYLTDFSDGYLRATGTEDKDCRSYGKGIMQTTFVNNSTGEALKLTTAKIYWPNGEKSIHDVGLTTDMGCKTVYADWDVSYGDEQLASAVQMIYSNAAF